MDRRQAMRWIGGLLSAPLVGGSPILFGRTVYGPLTIERHSEFLQKGLNLRVLIDGEDVTDRCTFADDTPGRERAELLKLDSEGQFYIDTSTDGAASETVTGRGISIVTLAEVGLIRAGGGVR